MESQKICFVITPIGPQGSDIRKRSDQILNHVIRPALKEHGYISKRADQIDEPGIIMRQAIEYVINAPLVIADLTDGNPNVFYELGIRHAAGKPYIQIIEKGQQIPFDVQEVRTVSVDCNDWDSAPIARKEVAGQIESIEKGSRVDSPVSSAIYLPRDGIIEQSSLASIFSLLTDIQSRLLALEERVKVSRKSISPGDVIKIMDRVGIFKQDRKAWKRVLEQLDELVEKSLSNGSGVGKEKDFVKQLLEIKQIVETYLSGNFD